MSDILANQPEDELKAREETICRGCGSDKETGMVVCWDCFKYRRNPLKEFDGSFTEWVKRYGVKEL